MSTERSAVSIEDELDASCRAYATAGQAPGIAYGIVSAGGLAHSAGYGTANLAGLVPDADTVFPIASMTKSFTACAALMARDRGLLDLDAPITDFVPGFTATGVPEDPCDPPTVRMLLSMSGGLTEDNSWVDPQVGMTEDELLDLVGKGLKYSHTPGTVYEYSNVGYALAGLAVARSVGRSVEEFVATEILGPLGMTSTVFGPVTEPGRRASGYSLTSDGRWVPFDPAPSGVFAPVGGLESTVRDLATWVTWLGEAFRPGHRTGPDVLSRASRRELQRLESLAEPYVSLQANGMWTPQVGGYALGLRVEHDLHRGVIVSHSGGLPGYKLHMCWHPDSGAGIVVLTNSHRGAPNALAHEWLQRLLHATAAPAATVVLWPETVRARESAEELVRHWDDTRAAELFAENVDFDRALADRRAEIDAMVAQIGPLREPRPLHEVVSAATPADVTWSIPGDRGELVCMVHLNELDPPRVQEFVVTAVPAGTPRSAAPWDVSPRRAMLGDASVGAAPNVRVVVPDPDGGVR